MGLQPDPRIPRPEQSAKTGSAGRPPQRQSRCVSGCATMAHERHPRTALASRRASRPTWPPTDSRVRTRKDCQSQSRQKPIEPVDPRRAVRTSTINNGNRQNGAVGKTCQEAQSRLCRQVRGRQERTKSGGEIRVGPRTLAGNLGQTLQHDCGRGPPEFRDARRAGTAAARWSRATRVREDLVASNGGCPVSR